MISGKSGDNHPRKKPEIILLRFPQRPTFGNFYVYILSKEVSKIFHQPHVLLPTRRIGA